MDSINQNLKHEIRSPMADEWHTLPKKKKKKKDAMTCMEPLMQMTDATV